MSLFIRLSTQALTDAKLLEAGPDAYWLWTRGLLYAKEHLTDGFVPKAVLGLVGLGLTDLQATVNKLLVTGLWQSAEGGFTVGQEKWSRHQTTRDQVVREREQARERQRRSRERRNSRVSHGVSHGVTHGDVTVTEHRAQSSREEANASSPVAADATTGGQPPRPSAKPAASTAAQPAVAASGPQGPPTRHAQCVALVHDYWQRHHPGVKFAPWDGGAAKQLSVLLAANPGLTVSDFERLLLARSVSEVNPSENPVKWLADLTDYASGPLDRYGKPLKGEGNGADQGSANGGAPRAGAAGRVQRSLNAWDIAAERRRIRLAEHADEANAGVLPASGISSGDGGRVPVRYGTAGGEVGDSPGKGSVARPPASTRPEILSPSSAGTRGA